MIAIHTPWRYSYGVRLSLCVTRPVPPLVGVGRDSDAFAGEYIVVVGVGLWWLFVTVSVMWWIPPHREE
jgi:hypothetical protein